MRSTGRLTPCWSPLGRNKLTTRYEVEPGSELGEVLAFTSQQAEEQRPAQALWAGGSPLGQDNHLRLR
jgi:hypothetical protein